MGRRALCQRHGNHQGRSRHVDFTPSAVIRRRPEIVAGMRITINSVAFDILDVLPDLKRRMYMTLICEAAR